MNEMTNDRECIDTWSNEPETYTELNIPIIETDLPIDNFPT